MNECTILCPKNNMKPTAITDTAATGPITATATSIIS